MPAGTTQTGDLTCIPEILEEAVSAAIVGARGLNGSSAAVINDSLSAKVEGGIKVQIPYFDVIGDFEELGEDEGITAQKLTMTETEAIVARAGAGISMTEWARLASKPGSDPYVEAANQIKAKLEVRIDKSLIKAARQPGADLLAHDISALSGGASKFGLDAMTDTRAMWGDEGSDIVLLGMHSKTFFDCYKLKDSTGRSLLVDPSNGGLPSLAGIPIKVSDDFAPVGDVYETFMFKARSVVFWFANNPVIGEERSFKFDKHEIYMNLYSAAARYKRLSGLKKGGVAVLKHK